MIDINTIITQALNTAIATAVAEATKPLAERINLLECDVDALRSKVEALENNPAIGVDTTLEARVKVLEEQVGSVVNCQDTDKQETERRLTALETAPNALSAAAFVTYLDQQEWFWEKLNNFAQSRVEEAIDDHLSNYDHDQYDEMYNEWGGESVSDFVKDDDIESQINDALRSASFDVRVTL
jgi:hypothetical protein